jgi:hypothetical protein
MRSECIPEKQIERFRAEAIKAFKAGMHCRHEETIEAFPDEFADADLDMAKRMLRERGVRP